MTGYTITVTSDDGIITSSKYTVSNGNASLSSVTASYTDGTTTTTADGTVVKTN